MAAAPGDAWLNLLLDKLVADHGYNSLRFRENEGHAALESLMNAINVNGDHHISRAEAESADIRVLGYSWGGTQAANFTRSINRVGKDVLGRKLDAPIAVRTLATIDPVEVFKLGPISIVPLKVTTGPVEANFGACFFTTNSTLACRPV